MNPPYEEWVESHSAELFVFASRMCGSRDTAEELVQETFFQAWKGRAKLRHHDRVRAWLYQILRHRYAHWIRSEHRRQAGSPGQSPEASGEAPPDRPMDRLADREALQKALDTLDDRLKVPLLMVHLEGLTCEQAAQQLDAPLGTVLSRIHRAKRHLRARLRQSDGHDQGVDRSSPEGGHPRLKLGGQP